MKLIEVKPNIYLLSFPSQKELTFTMCRVEEFYEAASDKLRGKVFTWAEFIDEFMNDDGELDYFHRWSGFNIPGDVFVQWASIFPDKSDREKELSAAILTARFSEFAGDNYVSSKFYVIAAQESATDIEDHEIAHAMYYIDNEYKAEMDRLNSTLDATIRKVMIDHLTELGYSATVHEDELQAYLSTSDYEFMASRFELTKDVLESTMAQYKAVFQMYK